MQLRAALFSIIGLGLAGSCVWLATTLLPAPSAASSTNTQEQQFVSVLVANSDIEFGAIIDRESLAAQQWPVGSIPEGAFISTSVLLGPASAGPRRARAAIPTGGLILDSNISDFGETVSMVNTLGQNTRAMSIQVDAVTGVGGFVLPGDRVDIVLTEGRGDQMRAGTILQDIRVLSVDQEPDETKRARTLARTLTVEVSPRDSQILALGQRAGTLSLTLRTLDSVKSDALGQISLADILAPQVPDVIPSAPLAAEAPAPQERTIRVRRGIVSEDVVVQ